jgi:hypothetical protein
MEYVLTFQMKISLKAIGIKSVLLTPRSPGGILFWAPFADVHECMSFVEILRSYNRSKVFTPIWNLKNKHISLPRKINRALDDRLIPSIRK